MYQDIIKNLLKEEVNKQDIDKKIDALLNSADFKKKIDDIIKNQIKNNKELEDKMVDISSNVLTQLYKTLWTKRSFWRGALKNKAN